MNKKTIYLETSFISYLTNRPSRDLIVAAHQQITTTWWEKQRNNFDLYVSEVVITEISAGDKEQGHKRLDLVQGITKLIIDQEAEKLAQAFLSHGALPQKAVADASHMAIAAVNGVDYLLSWNCKHIANAAVIRVIMDICGEQGYRVPVICTPLEMLGEENGEG
jgi:predicted nucleic acid-binding protein